MIEHSLHADHSTSVRSLEPHEVGTLLLARKWRGLREIESIGQG